MTAAAVTEQESESTSQHRNEVFLVGRLSGEVEERTLPSGSKLATWRVVVSRGTESAPYVDTIDCHTWDGRIRRKVTNWESGQLIELDGALRRRFWQGPAGPVSRYEVEVTGAKRLTA